MHADVIIMDDLESSVQDGLVSREVGRIAENSITYLDGCTHIGRDPFRMLSVEEIFDNIDNSLKALR